MGLTHLCSGPQAVGNEQGHWRRKRSSLSQRHPAQRARVCGWTLSLRGRSKGICPGGRHRAGQGELGPRRGQLGAPCSGAGGNWDHAGGCWEPSALGPGGAAALQPVRVGVRGLGAGLCAPPFWAHCSPPISPHSPPSKDAAPLVNGVQPGKHENGFPGKEVGQGVLELSPHSGSVDPIIPFGDKEPFLKAAVVKPPQVTGRSFPCSPTRPQPARSCRSLCPPFVDPLHGPSRGGGCGAQWRGIEPQQGGVGGGPSRVWGKRLSLALEQILAERQHQPVENLGSTGAVPSSCHRGPLCPGPSCGATPCQCGHGRRMLCAEPRGRHGSARWPGWQAVSVSHARLICLPRSLALSPQKCCKGQMHLPGQSAPWWPAPWLPRSGGKEKCQFRTFSQNYSCYQTKNHVTPTYHPMKRMNRAGQGAGTCPPPTSPRDS